MTAIPRDMRLVKLFIMIFEPSSCANICF